MQRNEFVDKLNYYRHYVIFGSSLVTTIFFIIACVTPNWFSYARNDVIDTRGLFFICHYVDDAYEMDCTLDSLIESPFWYFSVRGFAIIALIFHLSTSVASTLQAFNARMRYNENISYAIVILLFFSMLNLLITICIFGFEENIYTYFTPSYSAAIAIIVILLDFAMFVLCILQKYFYGRGKQATTFGYDPDTVKMAESPLMVAVGKTSNFGGSSELASATVRNTNQNSYSVAVA